MIKNYKNSQYLRKRRSLRPKT